MENVLKALGRNKLSSDSDQDGRANGDDTEIMESVAGGKDIDGDDSIKQSVSIDCTKALVILGFSNWTELEPGMQYTLHIMYIHKRKYFVCFVNDIYNLLSLIYTILNLCEI